MRTAPLLILALVPAAPTSAVPQWNEIERSQPFAMEACAAVNYQLERWETATGFYEALIRRRDDDARAHLGLATARTELGAAGALEACDAALRFPEVRVHALVLGARCLARAGDEEGALASLEEAVDGQLVLDPEELERREELAGLKGSPRFRDLAERLDEPLEERMLRLAGAGEDDALVALVHGNSLGIEGKGDETIDLLHGLLEDHAGRVRRGRAEASEGEALLRMARAIDRTLEEGQVETWVAARLRWDRDQIEAHTRDWKRLDSLASATRSHRFGYVIDTGEELARNARARGDLLLLHHANLAASLVHLATIDYRQPRRGVSVEEEIRQGTMKIRESLAVARGLGRVSGIIACLDYLGSLDIHGRTMPPEEFDSLICEAVVLSNQLVPQERELGMFEAMWRQRRSEAQGR